MNTCKHAHRYANNGFAKTIMIRLRTGLISVQTRRCGSVPKNFTRGSSRRINPWLSQTCSKAARRASFAGGPSQDSAMLPIRPARPGSGKAARSSNRAPDCRKRPIMDSGNLSRDHEFKPSIVSGQPCVLSDNIRTRVPSHP